MIKYLYIIIYADSYGGETYSRIVANRAWWSLDKAIAFMQDSIYDHFERNKLWWEYDGENSEYVERRYRDWITEHYTDKRHTEWSYINDNEETFTYMIHSVELNLYDKSDEVYAIVYNCDDGTGTAIRVLRIYTDKSTAINEMEMLIVDIFASKIDFKYNDSLFPKYNHEWIMRHFVSDVHDVWQCLEDDFTEHQFAVQKITIE